MIRLSELLAHLPPEPDEARLFPEIRQAVDRSRRRLVVIDDDPTGAQTVHDVELLLNWNQDLLGATLRKNARLFYLLTNSRSLPENEAVTLNLDLARQLVGAAQSAQIDFVLASRSDSTLRGHYPAEIEALETALRSSMQTSGFDGHLLVPAFFEGGRYTIQDTHYVATPDAASDTLLPAHETPFAKDLVFSYETAYLPGWIAARSGGRWQAEEVVSIGLELIRSGGVAAVVERLQHVSGGCPVIVNAAGYGDLAVVVLALLQAEAAGKRFLYRTSASFVRLRGAIENRALLEQSEVLGDNPAQGGGIVVVGSYVPGSSLQLERLLALPNVKGIEIPVGQVIRGAADLNEASRVAGEQLEAAVNEGLVGALYTSRELVTSSERLANLEIGKQVSQALVKALQHLNCRPRYLIAKGGITSHDIAQKGLGVERARVLGQLLPGVPVWRLEAGTQPRFQGLPYVVFPGNVGGPDALAEAVKMLSGD
ncbi:MAG TPA: four-carbon acid sugar kinase family protein [Ktedonobacteraceae bacterium]|nr:four-carbon acid sugar kinase family protein [Ktedonobacteraceae bacterium]